MPTKPVVVLGAGATKACGGPLTNEILPDAFNARTARADPEVFEREGFLEVVEQFLGQNFHLPELKQGEERKEDHFPPLPLLMSLVDIAIDRKHALGTWQPSQLVDVRDALEYIVFGVLEFKLRQTTRNWQREMLELLWPEHDAQPRVISLNYDAIIDNAMMSRSEALNGPAKFPEYGCDLCTDFYRDRQERYGELLKLHGSLNWLYCPGCQRLDLGISKSGKRTVKVLNELWGQNDQHKLEERYSCRGSPCPDERCDGEVRPVLITPTHSKDYRNPHISQIWYRAERMLREADRVIIVGYSLPEDDVDVVYLLKRGLAKVDPREITVIEKDKEHRSVAEHPVGTRYRALFGDQIDWRTEGFDRWVNGYRRRNMNPLVDRLPTSREVWHDGEPN